MVCQADDDMVGDAAANQWDDRTEFLDGAMALSHPSTASHQWTKNNSVLRYDDETPEAGMKRIGRSAATCSFTLSEAWAKMPAFASR
jgi:hypothetical protein